MEAKVWNWAGNVGKRQNINEATKQRIRLKNSQRTTRVKKRTIHIEEEQYVFKNLPLVFFTSSTSEVLIKIMYICKYIQILYMKITRLSLKRLKIYSKNTMRVLILVSGFVVLFGWCKALLYVLDHISSHSRVTQFFLDFTVFLSLSVYPCGSHIMMTLALCVLLSLFTVSVLEIKWNECHKTNAEKGGVNKM